MNREVRKKMKATKEEWTEKQCKNIERGMMSGKKTQKKNPKRLTIPSRLFLRPNSISQQSSKTAVETF